MDVSLYQHSLTSITIDMVILTKPMLNLNNILTVLEVSFGRNLSIKKSLIE